MNNIIAADLPLSSILVFSEKNARQEGSTEPRDAPHKKEISAISSIVSVSWKIADKSRTPPANTVDPSTFLDLLTSAATELLSSAEMKFAR